MTDVPRSSKYRMVSVDEAYHAIANCIKPLKPTTVPLTTARGNRLATDIIAPFTFPGHPTSMKDGYAFDYATAHTLKYLKVSATALAGLDAAVQALGEGECAYITTGAPMPPGTDTVVMVEHTSPGQQPDTIVVNKWPASAGEDVRAIGSDITKGEIVLEKNTYLGAPEIGILATFGMKEASIVPGPVIGVLSTGDELIDLDMVAQDSDDLVPFGKIVDSNRPMLHTAVKDTLPFSQSVDFKILRDSDEDFENRLQHFAENSDILITTGGVSMGSHDRVKPTLEKMGAVEFGRVNMKPGKPMTFAVLSEYNNSCFALPGNPVSAFVCFHLYVAFAARLMAGYSIEEAKGKHVDAVLNEDLALDPVRPEFQRARLEVSLEFSIEQLLCTY